MKHQFINTDNTRRFLHALKALEERGAEEACLLVVDGDPGLGKSRTVQWWAVQTGATFLRAKKEWRPAWMLRELLEELGIVPEYSFERMYGQAIRALGERAQEAERDGKTFAVVIDEADHISRRPQLLETLRDLSDMLEIPFVLVGMGKIRANLTRFEQVASRVAQFVRFRPGSLEDVTEIVRGLCDVQVSDDLIAFVHKETRGMYREVKEAVAAIERFGRRNSNRTIGLGDMKGQVLLNDRNTGKPIKVRA